MPSLMIRDLSPDLVGRIRKFAYQKGIGLPAAAKVLLELGLAQAKQTGPVLEQPTFRDNDIVLLAASQHPGQYEIFTAHRDGLRLLYGPFEGSEEEAKASALTYREGDRRVWFGHDDGTYERVDEP
jgi:hypothetical protein